VHGAISREALWQFEFPLKELDNWIKGGKVENLLEDRSASVLVKTAGGQGIV
jgi:hypothetical protein